MLCGHEVGCKGRSLHGEGIFFYIYTLKLSLCQLVLALGLGNERQLELCSEAQPQPSCLCFDLPGRQRGSSESSDRRGRITTLPLYGCRRAVLFPHLPWGWTGWAVEAGREPRSRHGIHVSLPHAAWRRFSCSCSPSHGVPLCDPMARTSTLP